MKRAAKKTTDKKHQAISVLKNSTQDLNGQINIEISLKNGTVSHVDCSFVSVEKDQKTLKHSTDQSSSVLTNLREVESFFIKENKTLQKLPLCEILYIKAMGDYVCIYTSERKITIHSNLKSMENLLPVTRFMRIHRSFIVAINRIDMIEEGTAYINTNPVPIGEAYRSKLIKSLHIVR